MRAERVSIEMPTWVIAIATILAGAHCRTRAGEDHGDAPPPAAKVPSPTAPVAPDERADKARVAVAAMIGTTPPAWKAERWMDSPPLELEKLRGSVVLVRWWTAGCPFCSTTAPSLRELDQLYASRGLHVIGMYHHKEDTPFDPEVYEDTAKKYGFTFPIALIWSGTPSRAGCAIARARK